VRSGDGFDCTVTNDSGTLVVGSDGNVNHNLTTYLFLSGRDVRAHCRSV
jgi:hypothetical protein